MQIRNSYTLYAVRVAIFTLLTLGGTIANAQGSALPTTQWLRGGGSQFTYVATSPDDQYVAALRPYSLQIYRISDGVVTCVIKPSGTFRDGYLKWGTGGTVVYAADSTGINGYSLQNGQPVVATGLQVGTSENVYWDISTDGQVVVYSPSPGVTNWYNVSPLILLYSKIGGNFGSLKFSQDGGSIAFVPRGGYGPARIWDVSTGNEIASISGTYGGGVEFTPNDQKVILGGVNGKYNVRSRVGLNQSIASSDPGFGNAGNYFVKLAPDGRRAGVWDYQANGISFYDAENGYSFVNNIPLGRDGYFSYTGGDNLHIIAAPWYPTSPSMGTLGLYRADGLTLEHELADFDYGVAAPAISPDGTKVFLGTSGGDGSTRGSHSRVYDTNGHQLADLGYLDRPAEARFTTDGTKLIVRGPSTKVFDANTYELIYSAAGAYAMEVDENKDILLLINGNNYTLYKIRLSTGAVLGSHYIGGNSLAISPDGNSAYVGSSNLTVRIRLSDFTVEQNISRGGYGGGPDRADGLLASRDGKWIYLQDGSRMSLQSGSFQQGPLTFQSYTGGVESPDRSYIIFTGFANGTYGVVHVVRSQDFATIKTYPGSNTGLAGNPFSIAADSRTIAYADGTGVGGMAKTDWGHVSGVLNLADWNGGETTARVEIIQNGVVVDSVDNVYIAPGGKFGFCTAIRGVCDIRLKAKTWLAARWNQQVLTDAGFGSLSASVLNGDSVPDNVIDLSDYTVVIGAFNGLRDADPLTPGDQPSPNWNADADLNQDGVVDLTDYTVVVQNFNAVGG